jgi:hypothetical protein
MGKIIETAGQAAERKSTPGKIGTELMHRARMSAPFVLYNFVVCYYHETLFAVMN